MKTKLFAIGLMTLALMAVAAVIKISEFPNTATPADTDLFLLARPSTPTNLNITWAQVKQAMALNGVSGYSNTVLRLLDETGTTTAGGDGTNGAMFGTRFKSTTTNAVILPCPDGGSFILTVGDNGTVNVVTNTDAL